MSTWWYTNLGDPLLADPRLEQIRSAADKAWAESGKAPDHAVLLRHESEGRLHCEIVLYFAPAAGALAVALGATPCTRPGAGDLSVLSGSHDALSRLFAVGAERYGSDAV